jgi:hypothetical protein
MSMFEPPETIEDALTFFILYGWCKVVSRVALALVVLLIALAAIG